MQHRSPQRGFTLLELMLGMTILTLVMAALFGILRSGMRLYESGTDMVELYQTGRIALRTVTDDLQFALASHNFWQPGEEIRIESPDQILAMMGGMGVIERDPGAIRFLGDKNQVIFVRKVYQFGKQPPLDLQECRYVAEDGALFRDVLRSLLMVKQASWFFRSLFEAELGAVISYYNGQQVRIRRLSSPEEPPLEQFIGNYGVVQRRELVAEGVESIEFQYSDGAGWKSTWDSEQIVMRYRLSPQSPNFNAARDMVPEKIGPPQMVQVSMTLINGDTLSSIVEIPAGSMQNMGGNVLIAPGGNPAAGGAFRNPQAQQPGQQPGQQPPGQQPPNETNFALP